MCEYCIPDSLSSEKGEKLDLLSKMAARRGTTTAKLIARVNEWKPKPRGLSIDRRLQTLTWF